MWAVRLSRGARGLAHTQHSKVFRLCISLAWMVPSLHSLLKKDDTIDVVKPDNLSKNVEFVVEMLKNI